MVAGSVTEARLRGLVRDGTDWAPPNEAGAPPGDRSRHRSRRSGVHGAPVLWDVNDHDACGRPIRDVHDLDGGIGRDLHGAIHPRPGGPEPPCRAGLRLGLSRCLRRPVGTGARRGHAARRRGRRRRRAGLPAERRAGPGSSAVHRRGGPGMGRPRGHRTARAGGGHRRRPDDHLGVRGHGRRRDRRGGRHAHHRVRPPAARTRRTGPGPVVPRSHGDGPGHAGVPGRRRGVRLRRGVPARPAAPGGRRRHQRGDRLVGGHLARQRLGVGRLLSGTEQHGLDRRRRLRPVHRTRGPGGADDGVRGLVLHVLDLREATAHLEHRGRTWVCSASSSDRSAPTCPPGTPWSRASSTSTRPRRRHRPSWPWTGTGRPHSRHCHGRPTSSRPGPRRPRPSRPR